MASRQAVAMRQSRVSSNLKRQLEALCLMNNKKLPEWFSAPINAKGDQALRNVMQLERVNKLLSEITGEPEDVVSGGLSGGPGPQPLVRPQDKAQETQTLRKLSKNQLWELAREKGVDATLKRDATIAELVKAIENAEA